MDLIKIISNMTLKQKIGQLMQYNANIFGVGGADITGPRGTYGLDEEDVMNVGSILNHRSAEDVRKIQDVHLSNDPNKIPIIFMMDVIHGYRTIYPIPLALGCSFNPEMVKECSRMASVELRFYNSEHKFVSEKGKFRLFVGYADHLINPTEFELI